MKIQLKIVSLVLVSNLLIEQKSTCAATPETPSEVMRRYARVEAEKAAKREHEHRLWGEKLKREYAARQQAEKIAEEKKELERAWRGKEAEKLAENAAKKIQRNKKRSQISRNEAYPMTDEQKSDKAIIN